MLKQTKYYCLQVSKKCQFKTVKYTAIIPGKLIISMHQLVQLIATQTIRLIYIVSYYIRFRNVLMGLAKLKKIQKMKKNGSEWVGPGPFWIENRKLEKSFLSIFLCLDCFLTLQDPLVP